MYLNTFISTIKTESHWSDFKMYMQCFKRLSIRYFYYYYFENKSLNFIFVKSCINRLILNWLNRLYLLLSLRFVICSQIIKQFTVHLHEGFKYIIDKGYDRLVPVLFRYLVQCRKHDWQNNARILLYQTDDVIVVPIVQRPFRHLKNNWNFWRQSWKKMQNHVSTER